MSDSKVWHSATNFAKGRIHTRDVTSDKVLHGSPISDKVLWEEVKIKNKNLYVVLSINRLISFCTMLGKLKNKTLLSFTWYS